MMMFEKAIKSITSRMSILKVEESRCTRNRSRLSKCSKCIDICPVYAITIKNKKILIGDGCIECGLCAGICPTDSIMIQEPTEKTLYSYIEENGKTNTGFILTCNKNENVSKEAFKVPCLGSLSLEFLIGADILPFTTNMIFKYEKCMECEAKKGIETYLENMDKVKEIRQILDIEKSSIINLEKPPKIKKKKRSGSEDIDEERRLFLNSIFKTTKNLPNAAINQLLGNGDKKIESKAIAASPIFHKYKILSKISKELRKNEEEDKELRYFYKPTIEDSCKLCGACSLLCPMGALKLEEKDNKKSLYLLNELCSGCELCKEVCYHKSIVMKNKSIYDFSNSKPFLLFEEEMQI